MLYKAGIKGFSLVELIVVIIILGILSVVAYPRYMSYQREARVAKVDEFFNSIKGINEVVKTAAILDRNNNKTVSDYLSKDPVYYNGIPSVGTYPIPAGYIYTLSGFENAKAADTYVAAKNIEISNSSGWVTNAHWNSGNKFAFFMSYNLLPIDQTTTMPKCGVSISFSGTDLDVTTQIVYSEDVLPPLAGTGQLAYTKWTVGC